MSASPLNVYTFYDKETKIWRGIPNTSMFNPKMGLGELIIERFRQAPNRITQISVEGDVHITCHEQRLRAIRVAQNLEKLGYKRGDIVALVARNGEKIAPVLIGCMLLGCPVNTLDATFDKGDLAHMLNSTRPKLIFSDFECLDEVRAACEMSNLNETEIVTFEEPADGLKFIDDILMETGQEDSYV
jgi:long-subunit acyl-CoA synthetase (AMP-forming)